MRMSRLVWVSSFLVRTSLTAGFLPTRHCLSSRLPSFLSYHSSAPTLKKRTALKKRKGKTTRLRASARTSEDSTLKKKKKKTSQGGGKTKQLLRADRVLSNRGWGTRSECSKILKQRRVFQQKENDDWSLVKGPSEKISMQAPLRVDDNKDVPLIPLLLVYHKPKWVLSVMSDPQGRPHVGQVLPQIYQRQKLHPVGRLDYDTSGLLLFSSSGPLTQRLLHPTHEIEKEYVAVVEGQVNQTQLALQLQQGVTTAEGVHTAELLHVSHMDDADTVRQIYQSVRDHLPSEYNVTDLEVRGYLYNSTEEMPKQLSEVRLVVKEGKHRMVRRILANCGHGVVELRRQRKGVVELGDLEPGQFRPLLPHEETWAQQLVSEK